jgi:hypothetical protein
MLIAKKSGNKFIVADYRHLYPDTSFPNGGPSETWMQENDCYPVNTFLSHDRTTQKLSTAEPYLVDNQVFTVVVEEKSEEDIERDKESQAAEVRNERNKRLNASDWTQLGDSPVNKTEWAVYRQQLRDITEQASFPYDVEWPQSPLES